MQLQDLFQAVSAKAYTFSALSGNPNTDKTHPVVIALNSCYRQILGLNRWPFLEKQDTSITTVAGTNAYSLSTITDLRQVDAVRISKAANDLFYDLENLEPQDFRDKEHLDNTPGTPSYWTMHAGNVKFWPYPDDAYLVTIDYIMNVPDLVNLTDVPVIPTEYQDAIVWGAVTELAYRERDWLGRNFADGHYQQRVKQLQEEYLLRQRQTSSHVKRTGHWDTQVPWPLARLSW